jgi:membrane-bound lytic murein transglycosylase F
MLSKSLILPLILLGFLIGCTPVDESVVKRADRAGEEAPGPALVAKDSEKNTDYVVEPAMRAFIQEHGATVKRQAARNGFDWRLILAMVKQESQFTLDAQSNKGASGYMQLMPLTEEEVARTLSLDDMAPPENNIRGGIYYLKTLYSLFQGADEPDRIKLALAAYNAGIGRIYDAQEIAAYLHENPGRWQSIKDALPLLSKRYYTLHQNVWDQEKPRAGWFGNSRETIGYVENVVQTYDELRLLLN